MRLKNANSVRILYIMSVFLNLLYSRFKSYLPFVYVAIAILLVVLISTYVYKTVYLPKKEQRKFQDVANASPTGREITVYMFHVDWCPHCKKAMPEWNMFRDQYNGKQVNGYRISCIDLDCTKADDPKIKAAMDKYDIKQYPTVIALVPGANGTETRVDYDASVKSKNLEKFVVSVSTDN